MFSLGKMQSVDYLGFSKNLLAVCELTGVTDEEISETCGVAIKDINSWRSGRLIPIGIANKIAKLADVNIETVF